MGSMERAADRSLIRHYEFSFAAKIFLPRSLKQLGYIQIFSGLKAEFNVVCSSRTGKNHVFALIEGQWHGDKTADSVLSMLRHVTDLDIKKKGARVHLYLTAENCGGQNNNQVVSCYCCCIIATRQKKLVRLCLPTPGHTKNKVDGAFGNVKRCLNKRDATLPADVTRAIE